MIVLPAESGDGLFVGDSVGAIVTFPKGDMRRDTIVRAVWVYRLQYFDRHRDCSGNQFASAGRR